MQPQKRVYRVKHPDDHYDHFNGCWIFLLVIVAGFILLWVFSAASSSSSSVSHEFARSKGTTNRLALRTKCVSGERLDGEIGACVPQNRYPIQAEPRIMDTDAKPCDSFFKHACGTWIAEHTNENRAFGSIAMKNAHTVHKVVTEAPRDGTHPIGTFYQSCLDTVVKGKNRRESILERNHIRRVILDNFWKIEDLPTVLGRLAHIGYTAPFSVSIEKHPTQNSMIPLIRWDGFEHVEADLVAAIFTGSGANGYLEANTKVDHFLKVQKELNKHHTHQEDSVTSYLEYLDEGGFAQDLTTMRAFTSGNIEAEGFSWTRYFEEIDGTALGSLASYDQQVWCPDRGYIEWFTSSHNTISVLEWRAWVEFSILYHTHDYVPSLPDNSYFRKHEWAPIGFHAARNVPHVLKRAEKRSRSRSEADCVRITQFLLPGLVSREYLQNSFTDAEQTRYRVQRLGEQIRDHVAQLIDNSEWLEGHTRRNLRNKVSQIIVRAVHPNLWQVEPFAHQLVADRYLHNLNLIRRWRVRQNLVLWSSYALDNHHLNRDVVARFGAPLSTVNAFYSPVTNTITVFAGILKPPFYDEHYNTASVMASIGSVLGHEFSHSVDSMGSRFDADGNFRLHGDGWISEQDSQRYQQRLQCIIDEYNVHDLNVDCSSTSRRKRDRYGEQTLGENIADIVGVRAAYETFLSLSNSTEKSSSARAWFWVSFAQMWCENYDQEHLCNRVHNDEHSVSLFRVDKTLRNLKPFQEDYGCIAGVDKMARPDDERCTLYG